MLYPVPQTINLLVEQGRKPVIENSEAPYLILPIGNGAARIGIHAVCRNANEVINFCSRH